MDQVMGRSVNQVGRIGLLAVAGALASGTNSIPDFTPGKLPTPRALMPQNVDTYEPPGTYEFIGGRLKALERGPEPPAPPPQPKKKPAATKKRPQSAT